MKSYPVQNLSPIGNQNPINVEVKPLPPIQIQNSKYRPKSPNNRKKWFLFTIIILLAAIFLITIATVIVINIQNRQNEKTTTEAPSSYHLGGKRKCSEGYVGVNCEIECGVIKTAANNVKIVGGQIAVAHSWPSIVLVKFSYYGKDPVTNREISQSSYCGGTLLDKQTVLTAAHCIPVKIGPSIITVNSEYPTVGSMYTVYLGIHDRTQLDSAGSQKMRVSQVFKHESYDDRNILNDIAILKLASKAILSDKIQVACLPPSSSNTYPRASTLAYVVGWGALSTSGSLPNELNDVTIHIYTNQDCHQVSTSTPKEWNSQICAGDLSGNRDSCQGDSGGPLYIQDTINTTRKFVLSGITSYGIGCATFGLPAIYTRVSYYINWIEKYLDSTNDTFTK